MDKADLYADIDESLNVKCHTIKKLEECKNTLTGYNFKVLSCNIRGLQHKVVTGQLFVALKRLDIDFDALVFSECWFNTQTPQIPTIPGYNAFNTTKVINKCGGVAIYVKECWSANANEPVFEDANCLVLNIVNQANIVGIYRSPAIEDTKNFISALETTLEPIKEHKNLIVAGDFNINLLDDKPGSSSIAYQCLMSELGLLSAISQPTRCLTCLDHIFVNRNDNIVGLICNSSLTDHDLTMVGLNLEKIKNSNKLKSRQKVITDLTAIGNELETVDWNLVLETDDVNIAANLLNGLITALVKKHTHVVKVSRNKYHLKPWITPGLIRCMRHRDNLHLQVRQQPNNVILKNTYTRYRNFCNNILRKVKANHDNSQIEKCYRDSKKLWKTLKEVCDIDRVKNDSQELLYVHSNKQVSINKYNLHFATVGSKLASDILKRLNLSQEDLSNRLNLETHGPGSFFMYATDQHEVNKLITDLKSDSAPGLDSFTPSLLKHLGPAIVDPVTHICNLSLGSGIFPDCWKTAVVCPIYKNGSKDKVDNYRPISLLPILSKILEKIVNKRLVDYLEKHKLLSDRQYGFRRGRSTEDAVEFLTSTLSKNMDKGNRSMGVFLDLAKAFDTISIPMLLKKLDYLGIRGNALMWFSSYLDNRKQRLKIGDHLSEEQSISFGVPQGSILSPTLFTIYMDSILKLKIRNAELICYADDTVAIFHGNSWKDTTTIAEKGMSQISKWLDQNLLTLNVQKTNFVAFHITRATEPKFDHIKIHASCCPALITFHNQNTTCSCQRINRAVSIKYLGVLIDQNITFEPHITATAKRARKLIFLMKTLRLVANVEVRKLVYTSLCQSLFQYCIAAWGGAAKSCIIILERAQRAVLKVMLGLPRRYPTQQLLQKVDVLSVRQLFVMKAVSRIHLSSQITKKKQKRSARLIILPLPSVKTVFASRLPPYIHIFAYNSFSKLCDLKDYSLREAMIKARKWLMSLNYDETESLVKVYDQLL